MHSTIIMGLVLIAISVVLLASHWRQWQTAQLRADGDGDFRLFLHQQLRRRTVASSLAGIVGLALVAFEQVPHTPWSITAYLFSLVLAASWMLFLGLADLRATRKFHDRRQLDKIAVELRRARANPPTRKREETRTR